MEPSERMRFIMDNGMEMGRDWFEYAVRSAAHPAHKDSQLSILGVACVHTLALIIFNNELNAASTITSEELIQEVKKDLAKDLGVLRKAFSEGKLHMVRSGLDS